MCEDRKGRKEREAKQRESLDQDSVASCSVSRDALALVATLVLWRDPKWVAPETVPRLIRK